MLDRQQTGDLFGLYLENKELSAEEFKRLMKGEKVKKVFLAFVNYDNGEAWEDHYERNDLLGVAGTFDKAIECFKDHIEARREDYKLVESNKGFSWNLRYIGNKDEFNLYACYESTHKKSDYDLSTYAYYIVEKEVAE